MPNPHRDLLPIQRPALFDWENQQRAEYQILRYKMLIDDFTDELAEWFEEAVGSDFADVLGIPDTSLNPLSSQTRQLTTPGLYGRPPTRRGPDEDALVGPRGAMRRYWPRMQQIQYLTVGMGVWFQAVSLARDGTCVFRSVKPFDVVVWVDDSDPLRPVKIWELRMRQVKGRHVFTWDQWDLGDLHLGGTREPSYRVVMAKNNGESGEDVSNLFIQDKDGTPTGALVGDSYTWRDEAGLPYLPWLVHRAVDDGEFWPNWRRAMHSGTLRASTLWTYTQRSALFATGEHTLVAGVDASGVQGQDIHQGDGNLERARRNLVTMKVVPGSMTFLPLTSGQNLQNIAIKAGVNLPHLSNFAAFYQTLLAQADGLNPTDAMRRSANPTSGAALEISSTSRREFSAAVQPLFLDTDLDAIQMCARIRTMAGLPTPVGTDDDPYTLEYHPIPLTPNEQKEQRDHIDWEEATGKIGPVEAYQLAHPGVDYNTAQSAVISAAVEKARIDKLVKEALEAEGLEPPPEPPPAPEPGEDPPEDPDGQVTNPEGDEPEEEEEA